MLFHLLCWAMVVPPALLVGLYVEKIAGHTQTDPSVDRTVVAIYTGLLLLSGPLLALSLLVPISPLVFVILLALVVLFTLSDKETRRSFSAAVSKLLNLQVIAGMAIIVPLAAYAAASRIKIYDTGLYHYPLTHWLATTGTVPGLALLSDNLGFTSTWFALAAGLDHGPFRGRICGVFNGLLSLLAIIHFSIALSRVIRRQASLPDWFLVGAYPVVFSLFYKLNYYSSLSPDLPAFILTITIGWRILCEAYAPAVPATFRANLPLLLLASGIVGLKLSAMPVLIIVLALILVRCHFQRRQVIPLLLVAGVVVCPVILANVVSSGYLLYPSPLLGLPLPWTVSSSAAVKAASVVTNWARCDGPCQHAITGISWIVPWLHAPQNLLMLALSAGAILSFIVFRVDRSRGFLWWILVLGEGGVLYVLLTAPNMRFAAGYLAVCSGLIVVVAAPKLKSLLPACRTRLSYGLIVASCMEVSFLVEPYVRSLQYTNPEWSSQLLMPSPLPARTNAIAIVKDRRSFREVPLTLASESVNGIRYLRPVGGNQCWGADVPCVPDGIKAEVRLRVPNDGFRSGFVRASLLHR